MVSSKRNSQAISTILDTANSVRGNSMATLIDTVALDTANIAVGSAVTSTAIVFGIKLEDISPLSCLITATGTIVKL